MAELVKAKEVTTVTVTDPDTGNAVDVMIFKEETGGMGGVDASYVEQKVGSIISPHDNGMLDFGDPPDDTVYKACAYACSSCGETWETTNSTAYVQACPRYDTWITPCFTMEGK